MVLINLMDLQSGEREIVILGKFSRKGLSVPIINQAIKNKNRHAGLDPASSRIHYRFRLSPE